LLLRFYYAFFIYYYSYRKREKVEIVAIRLSRLDSKAMTTSLSKKRRNVKKRDRMKKDGEGERKVAEEEV